MKKLIYICCLILSFFIFFSYNNKGSENKNIDLYKNDINEIPEALSKNCNNFIFTSENLNKKFNIKSNKIIVGLQYKNEIYLNSNYYDKFILYHELSHLYDKNNNNLSQQSEFSKFFNFYKTKEVLINSEEFFADCLSNYYLNKNFFKNNYFDIYQYFKYKIH